MSPGASCLSWCLASCQLSNGSFLPPWCLAGCQISCLPWCLSGCPNGPFLPPWCLPVKGNSICRSNLPRTRPLAIEIVLKVRQNPAPFQNRDSIGNPVLQVSLVSPWCLPGKPNGSFLPPWKWSFPASLVPPCQREGCPNGPVLGSRPWRPPQDLPRTGPLAIEIILKVRQNPAPFQSRDSIGNPVLEVSLVPPWCLPGCPIGSFLPPWCLADCPIDPFLLPWRVNPRQGW